MGSKKKFRREKGVGFAHMKMSMRLFLLVSVREPSGMFIHNAWKNGFKTSKKWSPTESRPSTAQ